MEHFWEMDHSTERSIFGKWVSNWCPQQGINHGGVPRNGFALALAMALAMAFALALAMALALGPFVPIGVSRPRGSAAL